MEKRQSREGEKSENETCMMIPDGASLEKVRKQNDEGHRSQDHPLKGQMYIPQTGMDREI